jgi:hypothetical protein
MILSTLMDAIPFSKTSTLTRTTRRHISEGGIRDKMLDGAEKKSPTLGNEA